MFDDGNFHQVIWRGDSKPEMTSRLARHQGAGHELRVTLRRQGTAVQRVTLACTCGEEIVTVRAPRPAEIAFLQDYGSVGPSTTPEAG